MNKQIIPGLCSQSWLFGTWILRKDWCFHKIASALLAAILWLQMVLQLHQCWAWAKKPCSTFCCREPSAKHVAQGGWRLQLKDQFSSPRTVCRPVLSMSCCKEWWKWLVWTGSAGTFRKHWNQQALQANYADLIGTSMSHIQITRGPAFHQAVFLYLKAGIPAARKLAQMVLLRFQQTELPRLEQEVRWVCARFGVVIAVDGSSAPLQEARTYVRKKDKATQASMERPGAAIRALALFDVPLCPTVFTRTEGRSAVAELVAFVVAQAQIGWVQDNTERMWASMVHVATKLMHSHELAGRIRVDRRAKEVKGFFVAIDPKHVEWRLQDALDSRSADFLHAAWSLRTVFSKLFNVTEARPVDGEDPLASSAETLDWQLLWKALAHSSI